MFYVPIQKGEPFPPTIKKVGLHGCYTMILSVSRRTDIPAYYSDWFFNRIKEGFVCTRNPANPKQITKIPINPNVVDGFVFWTKNPQPMMDRLDEFKDYAYYFQFTVTPYGTDIEPNIPSKSKVIIPTFQKLSEKIGKERVIWRYDPIFLSEKYTVEYHINCFEKMAYMLSDYTETCVISFVDLYSNVMDNMMHLGLKTISANEMVKIAKEFSKIANRYGITLESCSEKIDLSNYGIHHGHCIDPKLLERLIDCRLDLNKDKYQRPECGCAASIDIGAYNTCRNGCLYCYANHSNRVANQNSTKHNPTSPLIIGGIEKEDVMVKKEIKSNKDFRLIMI